MGDGVDAYPARVGLDGLGPDGAIVGEVDLFIPNRKFMRGSGLRAQQIFIQGTRYPLLIAKSKFICIHCLADLRRKGHGLVCAANDGHYGFITIVEASRISQEDRFMKIGQMFPSEYIRGIDVVPPITLTIKAIAVEKVRNREAGGYEDEVVLLFNEDKRKMRLTITRAREYATAINDKEFDTDNWIGNPVELYGREVKAFGKTHYSCYFRPGKVPKAASPKGKQQKQTQPELPANGGNGKRKPNSKVDKFFDTVNEQLPPEQQYSHPKHLYNTIGSWPDFDDPEDVNTKLDIAVAHALGKSDD